MSRGSGYKQPGNWKTTVVRIMARDGGRCYLCARPAISVDHIVSVAAGGSHNDSNLAAICATCKATKDEADRLAGIARQPRARRAPEAHPGLR